MVTFVMVAAVLTVTFMIPTWTAALPALPKDVSIDDHKVPFKSFLKAIMIIFSPLFQKVEGALSKVALMDIIQKHLREQSDRLQLLSLHRVTTHQPSLSDRQFWANKGRR